LLSDVPSLIVYSNVSVPVKPAAGVYSIFFTVGIEIYEAEPPLLRGPMAVTLSVSPSASVSFASTSIGVAVGVPLVTNTVTLSSTATGASS